MNALIVASSRPISSELSLAAKRAGADNIALAFDSTAAKRAVSDRAFDLIIIYGESFPGKSSELARVFAARGEGGVILIESAQFGEDIAGRLEEEGIILLHKPVSRVTLFQAIKMVCASNNRIARLVKEKQDLLKKLDDLRLVTRAKLILIQNMGFTEEQAHRYIEKRAMDLRRTRAEVAMDILKTYEV